MEPAHRVRNLSRTGLRLRLAKLPSWPSFQNLQLAERGEAGLRRRERDGGACGDVRLLSQQGVREGRTARRNPESEYSMRTSKPMEAARGVLANRANPAEPPAV
jgi:hypothetical protein